MNSNVENSSETITERETLLVTTDSYEEYEQELSSTAETKPPSTESKNSISEIQGEITCLKAEDGNLSVTSNQSNNNVVEMATSSKAMNNVENISELAENSLGSSEVYSEEEYWHNEEWLGKERHIFVLSSAGKPIYSRHGNEDKLVTVFGVMQALVSFVQLDNDFIQSIHAGETRFVFLSKGPLILVCVSKCNDSVTHIIMQLNYVFSQICSVLTNSQLNRIFEQRHNYDLRRLLQGSERLIDHLITFTETYPACFLSAIKCLPLKFSQRETITNAILSACSKIKNLVFAIFIAENELITLVRMKKYLIHPSDLHLIFNLVNSTESLRTADTWTPICLPKFDSAGFLHAHVSYLGDCNVCLLLLTVDHGAFSELYEAKQKITEKLQSTKSFETLSDSIKNKNVVNYELGEIRHFLYKSKEVAQFYCPEIKPPYTLPNERKRLFSMYLSLHAKLHCSQRPLKLIYQQGKKEVIFGWSTKEYEMYVIFEPTIEKEAAVSAVDRLVKWIHKETDKLFILNPATY